MIAKLAVCATALLLSPSIEGKPKTVPTDKPNKVAESARLDLLLIERNLIKRTNAERTRRGLPALKIDASLMKTARHHASWMARHRNLVHCRLPLAENIAMGQPTSTSAVRDWMNSSGHRANILNRGYKTIGAAAYRTASGTIYWCQQFRF